MRLVRPIRRPTPRWCCCGWPCRSARVTCRRGGRRAWIPLSRCAMNSNQCGNRTIRDIAVVADSELLEKTAAFYRLQLHRLPEAVEYLQQRGLRDPDLIEEPSSTSPRNRLFTLARNLYSQFPGMIIHMHPGIRTLRAPRRAARAKGFPRKIAAGGAGDALRWRCSLGDQVRPLHI